MSSVKERLTADIVQMPRALTLVEHIEAAGKKVPNQQLARHRMEAIRLGLQPHATEEEVAKAWFRRWLRSNRNWIPFSYASYVADEKLSNRHGPVPQPVQATVERIRKQLPTAEFRVYGLKEDPWLEVQNPMSFDPPVIIDGWIWKNRVLTHLI